MQLDVALALERASSSEKGNTKKAYRVLMTSLFHSRGPIYALRELSNSEKVLLQPSQEKVCRTPEGHARSSLKKIWQSCLIAFPVGYSTAHISDSLFNFMWMKQPEAAWWNRTQLDAPTWCYYHALHKGDFLTHWNCSTWKRTFSAAGAKEDVTWGHPSSNTSTCVRFRSVICKHFMEVFLYLLRFLFF